MAGFAGFLACCATLTAGGGVCEADLTGGMEDTEEEEEEEEDRDGVTEGVAAEGEGWEGFWATLLDGVGAVVNGTDRAIAAADWDCDATDDGRGESVTVMEDIFAARSAICV